MEKSNTNLINSKANKNTITNTNKKSELTLNNNIDVPKSITIVEVIQKSD